MTCRNHDAHTSSPPCQLPLLRESLPGASKNPALLIVVTHVILLMCIRSFAHNNLVLRLNLSGKISHFPTTHGDFSSDWVTWFVWVSWNILVIASLCQIVGRIHMRNEHDSLEPNQMKMVKPGEWESCNHGNQSYANFWSGILITLTHSHFWLLTGNCVS